MTEKKKRQPVEYTLEAFAKAEHWCWLAQKKMQESLDDADILKENSKDVLAQIMTDIENTDPEKKWAATELERLARSSEKWKKYREGQFKAQYQAGVDKVKYQSAVRYWETIQSGLSFKKTEMKRGI